MRVAVVGTQHTAGDKGCAAHAAANEILKKRGYAQGGVKLALCRKTVDEGCKLSRSWGAWDCKGRCRSSTPNTRVSSSRSRAGRTSQRKGRRSEEPKLSEFQIFRVDHKGQRERSNYNSFQLAKFRHQHKLHTRGKRLCTRMRSGRGSRGRRLFMHRSSRRSRGCAVGSSTPCPVGSRLKSIYGRQTCIRGRCGRQLQSHRNFPRQPPL